MAQNTRKIKLFSAETIAVIGRILAGTDEQALGVLQKLKCYKPIGGVNMMTSAQIARVVKCKRYSVSSYARRVGAAFQKGKWESDIDGILSISELLKAAGVNCEPSEGMKLVGIGPRNVRVNLYGPKETLAILYAFACFRPRIDSKVCEVYGFEHTELTVVPEPTAIEPVPGASPDIKASFTPAFVAELVRVCVRESVSAALASQAAAGSVHIQ